MSSSTREPRGAVSRAELNSLIYHAPVDMIGPTGLRFILAIVGAKHRLRPAQITEGGRDRPTYRARQEAIRLAYAHTRLSSSQLGTIFKRDHTTILYSLGHNMHSRSSRVERHG